MRKSESVWKAIFIPAKKILNWMILDQLSKNILKSEYHLDYMPKASKWNSIASPFAQLYEIEVNPTQYIHMPSILHLILETNRIFIDSSRYFLMTSLLWFVCYVIIPYDIRTFEGIQCILDKKTIITTNQVLRFRQLPSFYQQDITRCYFTGTTTNDCLRRGNCICTKGTEQNYGEIKKTCFLVVLLLKNIIVYFHLHGDVSFTRFSAVPLKATTHSHINGGRGQRKQRNELTCDGNVKCSYELANMKHIIEEKRFRNHGIYNLYNMTHLYDQIRVNEGNSRTSLFEEEAPDVVHNVAQEPIFYYSRQVLIGGLFKAY